MKDIECFAERIWGRFSAGLVEYAGWPWCTFLSFRNHLKDIPEAVSESQHVAYSHCELGGQWVGHAWGGGGGTLEPPHPDCTRTLPVVFQSFFQDSTGYFFHSRHVYALSRIPRENWCSWGTGLKLRQEIGMG